MPIQSFTAKVLAKEYITKDVVVLKVERPQGFEFKAGQFANFKIVKGEEYKMKSYSILSPPSQKETLDFCIKIVPDGFASAIFAQTKVGHEFEIKGPFGHFVFDETTDNEHWFLGAGTGLAPLYSMIKEFVGKTQKPFHLIFGTKTQADLLFHKEFLILTEKYDHFYYTPVLSRENWQGKQGHVQDHLPKSLEDKTFYICGLKELVLETKDLLASQGVQKACVKFERYS